MAGWLHLAIPQVPHMQRVGFCRRACVGDSETGSLSSQRLGWDCSLLELQLSGDRKKNSQGVTSITMPSGQPKLLAVSRLHFGCYIAPSEFTIHFFQNALIAGCVFRNSYIMIFHLDTLSCHNAIYRECDFACRRGHRCWSSYYCATNQCAIGGSVRLQSDRCSR